MADYLATLELRATAPDALPLRVELEPAPPRVVVTVQALTSWLATHDVKRDLKAVIAAQGDALGDRAQGDDGVLDLDGAVLVVAAVGGPALRLLSTVMGAFRDGEAGASRALSVITRALRMAPPSPLPAALAAAPPANLTEHMEAEKKAILDALEATRWDRGAAAERLGMPRRTFYRRMSEYGFLEGSKPRGKKAQRLRQAALEQMKGKASPKPMVALNLIGVPSSPKPGA